MTKQKNWWYPEILTKQGWDFFQQPIFSVAVDIFLSPSHGGFAVAETLVILDGEL